jgi:1,4-alpha-glucan branching enzyme
VRHDYRLGVPLKGHWVEILNSDLDVYGGSGVSNHGRLVADYVPWHGQELSLSLTLPPLAVVVLAPIRQGSSPATGAAGGTGAAVP